jgi:hypothetical protein
VQTKTEVIAFAEPGAAGSGRYNAPEHLLAIDPASQPWIAPHLLCCTWDTADNSISVSGPISTSHPLKRIKDI